MDIWPKQLKWYKAVTDKLFQIGGDVKQFSKYRHRILIIFTFKI